MSLSDIPTLEIGNLKINPPIIQGGMGIRVSVSGLAAAVANTGCVGVIASTGIGAFEDYKGQDLQQFNSDALRDEIRKTRKLTNGVLGVNIMVALIDYESLAQTAIEEKVDMIICGAGLPLDLPKFFKKDSHTKLVPIVSSPKALELICRRWLKRYNKLPDAVVVEGPDAGGHLGYSNAEIENKTIPPLEDIVRDVVKIANSYDTKIPVIAAGGIFDGADIARFLKIGASGVQMATRFVCTDECDADIRFKQAYINAKKEDSTIIKSPVGLPGRVLDSEFVKAIKRGETMPFQCMYQCLRTCDPEKAPYCIAKVLGSAAKGDLHEAFAFAGSNAYKCTEIIPVAKLVEDIKSELSTALDADKV